MREVEEWFGKSDSSPVPTRVRRKPKGEPITADYFFERSIPEPNSGCWIWLNAVSEKNGYGVLNLAGKTARAHRISYEIHRGIKVPRHIDVCHTCDIRCCVNPDHLFLGTRKENMRDCANKGRVVMPGLYGEACPASILTERDVLAIRASSLSQRELGRRFGVDKGTIAHIVHRKTWRHI